MPYHASPSARINPVAITALLIAALTSAALIAVSFSGATRGAVEELLRTAGFGQARAVMAEQHRQAQTLETIEHSMSQVQAEVALLNVRVSEAESLYRDAGSTVSARLAQINPAQGFGPEFELAALRTSFDGTIDERRQNLQPTRRWRAPRTGRGATNPARTVPSV
jgi:hypothetical protein